MTIKFGIISVSDRSFIGKRPDTAGPAIKDILISHNWQIVKQKIIPDEIATIQNTLERWSDSGEIDVLITTGGTGFSLRDVTPEATLAVVERATPGISEAMRAASIQVTPHAMLSRAVSGIRKKTLIINLPGSPKAAVENLETILPVIPHAVQLLTDDPNAESGHKFEEKSNTG